MLIDKSNKRLNNFILSRKNGFMSSKDKDWIPEFKWHKVDLKSYLIIYNEAKERMEYVLSESESITNKSIQFIAAVVATASYFLKLFIDEKIPLKENYYLILFLVFPILLFLYLIFPKDVRVSGFQPKEFIPKDLDSDEDQNYQELILYFNGIANLQRNISYMNMKNEFRSRIYFAAIISSLIMFLAYVFFYIKLLPTSC